MRRVILSRHLSRVAFRLTISSVPALLWACAAGAPGVPTVASESEWRALAAPRPEALPGAARVAVSDIQLVGDVAWGEAADVLVGVEGEEIAIAELVNAGLLRRRDVHFVERRRFTIAAAAERRGDRRPPGAPPAGVSPVTDLIATAAWLSLMPGEGSVEARLADPSSGAIQASARVLVAGEAHPVTVARSIVAALLDALEAAGRLPAWTDPVAGANGTIEGNDIAAAAVSSFLEGLAAEERYDWEAARRGYQAALDQQGFFEAAAALARTARLRLGGTLGES